MRFALSCMLCACVLAGWSQAPIARGNVVTDWAAIVQPAIAAGRPPASAEVHHALVQLAVYDAVMAIEGTHETYAPRVSAPPGSDVRTAVATAAWRTTRARVDPSQASSLDMSYASYIAGIADGRSKDDGIQVGATAAAAVLALRKYDGYDVVVEYQCSANPPGIGEFEPNEGCGTQPVDAKLAAVTPYTFSDPGRVDPGGPREIVSAEYTKDFIETRDYGHRDSALRTADQTDVVYFWSENTYAHWNRNLIDLALDRHLNAAESARLFAMVHSASADAIIVGFNVKYRYRFWRPVTAIRRAEVDGNPDTPGDPEWIPLLNVNHPEYPAAHAFWSAALTDMVASFFGTRNVSWTIRTSTAAVPQLRQTARTYNDLDAIVREIQDARVWAGLHWRDSTVDGARIGNQVATHVSNEFFWPRR